MRFFFKNKRKVIFICFLSLFINCFAIAPRPANAVVTEAVISYEVVTALVGATVTAYTAWELTPVEQRKEILASCSSAIHDVSNFRTYINTKTKEKVIGWSANGLLNLQKFLNEYTADTSTTICTGGKNYFVSSSKDSSGVEQFFYVPPYTHVIGTYNGFSRNFFTKDVGLPLWIERGFGNYNHKCYILVRGSKLDGSLGDELVGHTGTFDSCSMEFSLSEIYVKPSSFLNRDKLGEAVDNPSVGMNVGVPVKEQLQEGVEGNAKIYVPSSDTVMEDVLPRVKDSALPDSYVNKDNVWENTGENVGEGDTTGNISDGILNIPILGAILKALLAILDFLKGLVSSLVDALISALQALLTALFVPADNFFIDKFNGWKDVAIGKLGNNNLNFLQKANSSGIRDIYVDIAGKHLCIVKLSIFENVKDSLYGWLKAFFYFLLILFNFNKIIKMLKGSVFSDYDSRVTVQTIKADEFKSKHNL
ncbi:hypothetical protein [Clostridium botulinum]|uniref:hypothetical protein n=1 Tax=Clostridium botulinum TaxID=1491 RepID=UPI000772F85B|nr:hypothetical protein [Clostridium botulinum]NFL67176.1 hypothetical protein [Clostridium botulinum]NFN09963.1 hypothetical protein [Clostridium botulinum]NFN33490.1 hypothetical protein [Clostridium botulinum]